MQPAPDDSRHIVYSLFIFGSATSFPSILCFKRDWTSRWFLPRSLRPHPYILSGEAEGSSHPSQVYRGVWYMQCHFALWLNKNLYEEFAMFCATWFFSVVWKSACCTAVYFQRRQENCTACYWWNWWPLPNRLVEFSHLEKPVIDKKVWFTCLSFRLLFTWFLHRKMRDFL